MRRSRTLLLAALSLACMTAATAAAGPSQFDARAEDTSGVTTALQTDPLTSRLDWTLAHLNGGGATLNEDDVNAHFAEGLLAAFPAELIAARVQELASAGPFTMEGYTRPPTNTQATVLLNNAAGSPYVLELAIEVAAPHGITALNLRPVPMPEGVAPEPFREGDPTEWHGLVDIGGRRLYLSCRGTGSPTVILESAEGDGAAPWFGVERGVATFTRVCSYDRANTFAGASDPAPASRTAAEVVADLHALLDAADVPGPYVLAGHTLGGLFARLYAGTYPDDVAGMVLVDAGHEEQDRTMQALLPAEVWAELQARIAASPPLEPVDVATSYDQMRESRATRPLRPMPLSVLADVRTPDPAEFPEGWPLDAIVRAMFDLQRDLATLVPGAELLTSEGGNYIHHAEPDLVVDAIRRVVEQTRR